MRILPLFRVSVVQLKLPNADRLNERLKERILAERARYASRTRTSRSGGWQSKKMSPKKWHDESFNILSTNIAEALTYIARETIPHLTNRNLEGWQLSTWANINPKGAYNSAHRHRKDGSLWSGVYYVDVNSSQGGEIIFEDRSLLPVEILDDPNPFKRELVIQPQPGELVLFPAMLTHRVEPNRGDKERIIISFNAKHHGYVVPLYSGMKRKKNWAWKYFLGPMTAIEKAAEFFKKR